MQVVIPMAGIGKRFLDAGFKLPKPLIEVGGKSMIGHIVDLFPGENYFVFICNEEHLKNTPLCETLLSLKPKAAIFAVEEYGGGPVRNIIRSAEYIKDKEPVIVSYCDFDMHWDYADFLETMREKNPDSASVCYKGFHPHLLGPNLYAGVRADKDNFALEVREKHSFTKNKMDTWQQAGVFYFRSGALLKKYAVVAWDSGERIKGECYVSHLFNPMIRDGLVSYVYPVEYFCQWGTPDDLAAYRHWMEAINSRMPTAQLAAYFNNDQEKTLSYWRGFLKERSRRNSI